MIFHDSIYDGHHMMDWDIGNWFFMILGWGIIISAFLIILYVVLQSTTKKNQIQKNVVSKENDVATYNEVSHFGTEKTNFEMVKFCFNCGEKLSGEALKFCPRCGAKITGLSEN